MEEAPGTTFSFVFVVVVTLPSSSSWMGFDDKYRSALSQEIANFTFSLEVIETTKDSICKTIHRSRDSRQVLCRDDDEGVARSF